MANPTIYFLITFAGFVALEAPEKEIVKIGLVYQGYTKSKTYEKTFRTVIQQIGDTAKSSTMRKVGAKYVFAPVDCTVPRGMFYVSHVLHCLCDVFVKEKVAVIIFITSTEEFDSSTAAAQYFLTMASHTGIPIIAFNADNSGFTFIKNLTPYRILQFAPPIEHQIQAMLALLNRYNWSKFGVVASNMAGSNEFIESVYSEVRKENQGRQGIPLELIFDSVVDTLNASHVHSQMAELRKSQAKIVLLYSTGAQAKVIFEKAESFGLLSEKYLWIGTQSVKGMFDTFTPPVQPGMLSINFYTKADLIANSDDVVALNIGMAPKLFAQSLVGLNDSAEISLQSDASCKANEGSASWKNGAYLYEAMKNSSVKGYPYPQKDSQSAFVFKFDKYGKLKNSLLTVSNLRLKTKDRQIYFWEKVGEFYNGELRMQDVQWPGGKANPPQGSTDKFHVKVVTLHEPPFITVSELDPDTGLCPGNQGSLCDWGKEEIDIEGNRKNRTLTKCCSGYCVDLLNKLANDIGFTYTLYKVRDEKWGLKTEKGWNGLIADLINHKADMCVTSLKLNSERAKDIDFSIPFLDTGISIIVKIRSGVLSPTAFLEPFEYSTWVIILCVSIQGAALAIFIFEWVSPYSFNMQRYPPPDHKFSLCRSYWLVWATLFSASVSTDVPRSAVSRCMALVWAAFGLTFLAVYTANLAAFMITRVQYYDLSGIHDPMLIYPEDQKPPFRFGTVDGGNTHETMKRNWHRMNDYVERNNFFVQNVSAGVEAVRNDQLDAFIYDAVVIDYMAGKDPNCELTRVGKWSSMTGYGIGFPKNSPYVQMVNQWMLQYQQNGDLERLQNFWLNGACTRDGHTQTQSAPLGVENFMSAFLMLGGGIIIALIVLGFEHIYCHQLRTTLQKLDPRGWCGIVSMAMGKSLTLQEATERVKEWRSRAQSLASTAAPTSPLSRRTIPSQKARSRGGSEASMNSRRCLSRSPLSNRKSQFLNVETIF
ncbi:unnamed protein product, partial [Mesorhabditis belari]|uniref:Uncharacterized protein n=1 Tax=Mesorhabditis belari TaxID=2138241 RepID=A0AAF3EB81_9BILA